jgi:MFS family permease
MFMAAMDITILSTIMPHIIASLGDMPLYPIASSSFLVAFFMATPIFGLIADHYGCKKIAFVAIGTFLFGSLCSGCSPNMKTLIVARFIQGLGGGGLINICFITIGKMFSQPSQRSIRQAVLSAIWAVASIVGPFIGATLTYAVSWRAVFLINIPIGLFAYYCFDSFREEHEETHERFDKKGLYLFVSTTLLLFLSFSSLFEKGFTFNKLSFLALGIGSTILFVHHCLTTPSPFIHLELLKNRTIAVCIFFGVLSGACLTISSTLISLYIQGALRQSLQMAGFVIAAESIGWAIGSFFCGLLLHKLSIRTLGIISLCMLMLGFFLLSFATLSYPMAYFLISNGIVGFGIGSCVNITIVGVQKEAQRRYMGRATSFLSLMRSGGSSIGALFAGFSQLAFFQKSLLTTPTVPYHVSALLLSKPSQFLEITFPTKVSKPIFTTLCELFSSSIEQVFFIPVILVLLSLPLTYFLPERDKVVEVK